jgi:hypothetical protein
MAQSKISHLPKKIRNSFAPALARRLHLSPNQDAVVQIGEMHVRPDQRNHRDIGAETVPEFDERRHGARAQRPPAPRTPSQSSAARASRRRAGNPQPASTPPSSFAASRGPRFARGCGGSRYRIDRRHQRHLDQHQPGNHHPRRLALLNGLADRSPHACRFRFDLLNGFTDWRLDHPSEPSRTSARRSSRLAEAPHLAPRRRSRWMGR